VAERNPGLVRAIQDGGHELACHGHDHRMITRLTPAQFGADVRRARAAIEDASGTAVVGYRAPTFSVVRETLWSLKVLAEAGFRYDSSIFPIVPTRRGFPIGWRSLRASSWWSFRSRPSGCSAGACRSRAAVTSASSRTG
jgi:peptidoglycan/xylan/chitin deacetylase (PgdA/CDA1 family)